MNKKFDIIAGDIHELIKIKKDESWNQYAWRIHSHSNYYYVSIKDEGKHGFNPKCNEYNRKKIHNNYELFW